MLDGTQITEADIDAFLASYNATLSDGKKPLEFDEVRRTALIGWGDLQACPGSGKTTLVAAKLMIIAKKWKSKYRGICVLTHTNVACDEIRLRLEKDVDGYKLLSYPHFIGTIQEFVNRFMGLPYIRNQYEFTRFVEENVGCVEVRRANINGYQVQQICQNLYRQCNQANYENIKDYLGSLHYINAAEDLRFFKQNNSEEISKASSPSGRRKMLYALKEAMCKSGIFNYRDMYAFSEKILVQNSSLTSILQHRFPFVFIDEMQDTQKFQDDLINNVYDCDEVKIQRFGDPDQAIFNNMGNEESNETFNENSNLAILAHSHRFSEDIASKVSSLSYSQIGDIQALAIPDDPYQHTVIVYDDDSKKQVLNIFAEIVAIHDEGKVWSCVKAVGATEGEGEYISDYWGDFDRRKSVKSPRPEKLIDIISREWWKHDQGTERQYKLIVQGVLDLLRIANVMDVRHDVQRYFNVNSLKSWLMENEQYLNFRKLVTDWILNDFPSNDRWNIQMNKLKEILGLAENFYEITYITYNNAGRVDDFVGTKSNIFQADNGRNIEVGTIHSVKGETHDATLILETKNHRNDLEVMLPYFIGELPSRELQNIDLRAKPHHNASPPQNKQFLRQFYVASSRPSHLLCLAIHKDHLIEVQVNALEVSGWCVKPIYEIVNQS